MKIGILTLPLRNNYGGLLQAYALKEMLESLDHEVVIIDRRSQSSRVRVLASTVKSLLLRRPLNLKLKPTVAEKLMISSNVLNFRKKYLPNFTKSITTQKGMLGLNKMGFNAYVVGSDQCWRPEHLPKTTNYFLDFAEKQENIKRIAYAASFGVSEWTFTEEETKRCSELAKKFDAISVREDSGVSLVNKHFAMDAEHLIDPTMLLAKEHYVQIVNEEKQLLSEGSLKVYILDKTSEKQEIVDLLESKTGLKQFEILPKKRLYIDELVNTDNFIYPNPAKWLRGFQDAQFVVTDSFHGTIFSLLFNIPFIAIGNKARGMARFESLLKMFGLEDRLVTDISSFDANILVQNRIDWDAVNAIIKYEREKAIAFLKSNLK